MILLGKAEVEAHTVGNRKEDCMTEDTPPGY